MSPYFPLSPSQRNLYSIERLRVTYIDLLQHIDIDKEDLGRCGIDGDDEEYHKKSMRFSFRRKLLPRGNSMTSAASSNSSTTNNNNLKDSQKAILENESRDEVQSSKDNRRELVAAFRMLSATKSPDKEAEFYDATANRDEASMIALSTAKAIEKRVVELIKTIGEIIVKAEEPPTLTKTSSSSSQPAVRGDPVFEYFCEKNILKLFVDIAKEVRQGSEVRLSDSLFHGVVWSPMVKAQVLQTTSLLLSDISNHSVLYYLLSHNHINNLISCMLPLKQWTDQALVKMMPSYVELLRVVTVQLANDPTLFPFLTIDNPDRASSTKTDTNNDDSSSDYDGAQQPLFPLFTASIEVATSTFAESDSFIYGTSLAAIVNIMQISHHPIQDWVANAGFDLRRLAEHLCQRLLDKFYKVASLTTGPIVDGVRSNAISGQLAGLRDQLKMMRELFWSGVRGLDVRLCEYLLQRVVNVLLKCLLPGTTNRPFLAAIGEIDIDVIPDSEAMAQVATIFLAQMFTNLEYVPLQRMLAVALFHPKSTNLWSTIQSTKPPNATEDETYIFMPALSDIVNGSTESTKTIANPYREEIFKTLGGENGEWRVLASSCLVQSMIISESKDFESLDVLGVIPRINDILIYEATPLENAIASYLHREHRPSRVSQRSLESVGMLSLRVIQQIVSNLDPAPGDEMEIKERLSQTVLWQAMEECLDIFRGETSKCLQKAKGSSGIFLDVFEAEIAGRYRAHFENSSEETTYLYYLNSRDSVNDSTILVRKNRDVSSNEVETARFYIRMILHYRALRNILDRYCVDAKMASKRRSDGDSSLDNRATKLVQFKSKDKADLLIRTIGGLQEKSTEGSDLDLTGRMSFACRSAPNSSSKGFAETSGEGGKRDIAKKIASLRSDPRLLLVLDPTDMNVVKPAAGQMEENRGTIQCRISLRSVIAAAADSEWLHIAVRHEDVTSLIKNGKSKIFLWIFYVKTFIVHFVSCLIFPRFHFS